MMCCQPLLRLFALRDITGNHDYILNPSRFIPNDAALRLDKTDAAIVQQKAILGPLPRPGGDSFAKEASDALAIVRVDFLKAIGAHEQQRIA